MSDQNAVAAMFAAFDSLGCGFCGYPYGIHLHGSSPCPDREKAEFLLGEVAAVVCPWCQEKIELRGAEYRHLIAPELEGIATPKWIKRVEERLLELEDPHHYMHQSPLGDGRKW